MPFRDEIRLFISACENIHGLLAGGGALTEDEKGVVENAAIEVLAAIRQSNGPAPERPWLL